MANIQRKLAAILAADVAGYSTLVGNDEEATIRSFRAHLSALSPIISAYSGRLFKTLGDGFLVEFGSVVDAVSCSVAMQERIAERNVDEPQARQLVFRMGVHVGDVIVDEDDILGDGVNVAARLEGIAKPGGVLISARVFDDVENKLDLNFIDGGFKELKNIAKPVQVYEVSTDAQQSVRAKPARPDKPSLAVLPFDNISSDLEQEYFVDGLSEDLITALSYVPWIFVIARNSSFTYKGLTVDVRKIGEELGVRYVLEGSVRRAGGRVRVTGQLIDTETGNHIWADRFDSSLEDIFELQDKITSAVVEAIAPKIESAEIERATGKPPDSLTAYDHYLKARAALNNLNIPEAATLLDKAIAESSDYAKAKAVRAWCYTLLGWRGAVPNEQQRSNAIGLANEALASANADSETSAYAGYTIAFMHDNVERGIKLVQNATVDCPSFAWAWASLALLEYYFGSSERAIEIGQTAARLNPRDPQGFRSEMAIAGACFNLNRFEECLKYVEIGLQKDPDIRFFLLFRIVCLVQLDQMEQARLNATRFIERYPTFKLSELNARSNAVQNIWRSENMEDVLRTMGLPD